MPRFVRCLLTIGVLAGLPATAWADWTRMRTANFLFIAETTDRQLRETARKLEQFREVMLRALPNASAVSPVPTVVILFRQDRSFSPFKPQFEGRNTDVAGYFLGHEDVNYLVVNIENGELGFSTVFHEYSHFLIGNTLGHVPVWVSEGLAQFYESFEERDSGRIAVIGMPIGDHIAVLRQSTPIPIRDLIAVDSQSPIYNEGNRRGLFYAQSWALMHYLYLGSNQERTPQLHEYLTQIRAGAAPDGAFRKAFGDTSILDKELRGYVNQVTMTFMRMTSDSEVETAIPQRGDKIDDLEADTYLGDLQARLGRNEDAQARLQRVLGRRPATARATQALGLIELRADRLDAALPLLERAASEGPDDGQVQGAFGRALVSRLSELEYTSAAYASTLKQARTVLARAVELDPNSAQSLALLGFAELAAGDDLKHAETLLARAIVLAPSREEYRLLLAQAYLREAEFSRATDILGVLLATGSRPAIKDQARELLAAMAKAKTASQALRPALTEPVPNPPTRPSASSTSAAPESAPVSPQKEPPAEAAGAGTSSRRGVFIPALRPVAEGETRVLGTFRGIVCGPELTVLAIQTQGRLLQLRQNPSRPPDFISYVANPPKSVGCGPINPPQRVLATYTKSERPSTAYDGDAVAIELVPDDFTPP
jgi:tetratricopeptide (TPR) repeat protein